MVSLDYLLQVAQYVQVAILAFMVFCIPELVGLFPTFSIFVARDTTYNPTPEYKKLVTQHILRKEQES